MGDLRVRDPDLRGLQRLHRHRHRLRAAARPALPPELRRAVHGHLDPVVLAAVAHHAVVVAARLPLHPAGRAAPASERRTERNLFLTMVIGGLWHGAAWTFVVWGAIHGAALVVERRWTAPPGRGRARSTGRGPRWSGGSSRSTSCASRGCSSGPRPSSRPRRCSPARHPVGGRHPGEADARVRGRGDDRRRSSCRPGWSRPARSPSPAPRRSCRAWPLALGFLVIDALGPTGVAPFIYFQF